MEGSLERRCTARTRDRENLILPVLEAFLVRETNVKNICVELAAEGVIDNTWKVAGKKKPFDGSEIRLRKS